ncbi:hypothetical protein ACE1TI_16300 [Alteribacillus sp. JSM 102045]|uniref:hypothetical protein n=1 Tax=Alteribacillus sp. JSM 102045 TaxID=1562101 RepID=UPI0035BF2420
MHKEAARLKRLIEDLFYLAKMEEGKIDLEEEAIYIKEVLETVVERIQLRANEKGIGNYFEIGKQYTVYIR